MAANKSFWASSNFNIADRTFEDSALRNNRQQGNLLRLQAQFNFRDIIQECKTSET
jgi:hypothetical protein